MVAIFLERLARGEETVIYGDGSQSRDFVFVDDIVSAALSSVGRSGGPYNVGSGEATSIADLHRACAAVAGSTAEPRIAEARLGDVHRSVLDVSLIGRELDWRPRVSLADGLARTWTWTQEALAA